MIAGGDEVVPFFRYPDTSGLGQESQFDPPILPDSPAGASLAQDQVQSQDAYGSDRRRSPSAGRRPARCPTSRSDGW